jgi:hypothetical protein
VLKLKFQNPYAALCRKLILANFSSHSLYLLTNDIKHFSARINLATKKTCMPDGNVFHFLGVAKLKSRCAQAYTGFKSIFTFQVQPFLFHKYELSSSKRMSLAPPT